jgi:aminopeptidase N
MMNNKFIGAVSLTTLGISVALAVGVPGSSSLNDPLYPWMGNGGYDAQHYTIDLRVPADHKTIKGMSVMTAIATDDLSSFNLDLGSLQVKTVSVNGVRAAFKHEDPELTITPRNPISKGSSFRVQVVYQGTPGSKAKTEIIAGGWTLTPTGAVFLGQPTSLKDIAAVNDAAADKATFSFRLTAPQSEQAIANGIFLNRRENKDGTATSFYKISEPTTTYMPMVAFGPYKRIDGGTVDGVQIRNYLLPNTSELYNPALAKTADMIRFFNQRLGKYPFREYGIITHDYVAEFALENQTLSSFPAKLDLPDGVPPEVLQGIYETVLAHELAHQWFAASVSYRDHSQTFIHEGFAEFLGRLWVEHSTGEKLEDSIRNDYPGMVHAKDGGYFQFPKEALVGQLRQGLGVDPTMKLTVEQVGRALDLIFSGTLPAAMRSGILERATASAGLTLPELGDQIAPLPFTGIGVTRRSNREVRQLLDPSLPTLQPSPTPGKIVAGDDPFDQVGVYNRGAATVYALKLKVGDATFWKILRTYLERNRFKTATNEDFLKVVAELGGADARALTERWLFDDRVPDFPELGLKAEGSYPLGADFKP